MRHRGRQRVGVPARPSLQRAGERATDALDGFGPQQHLQRKSQDEARIIRHRTYRSCSGSRRSRTDGVKAVIDPDTGYGVRGKLVELRAIRTAGGATLLQPSARSLKTVTGGRSDSNRCAAGDSGAASAPPDAAFNTVLLCGVVWQTKSSRDTKGLRNSDQTCATGPARDPVGPTRSERRAGSSRLCAMMVA